MYYQTIISELENELGQLSEKELLIKKAIDSLKAIEILPEQETTPKSITKKYEKNGSYKSKLPYLLDHVGRFVRLSELIELAQELEPTAKYNELKKGLASAKSNLLKEGNIIKYAVENSNKNTFYGFENWLKDGEIKPEFMYDTGKLI